MKTKMRLWFNTILTFVLGVLGFSSCFRMEYGTPYATIEASGKVSDAEAQPVENIQVSIHHNGYPVTGEVYTNQAGCYDINSSVFPTNKLDIVFCDTAGVYATDSVQVDVSYDKSEVSKKDHWNSGRAVIEQDFQLKKK